jgi:hypothetical protein
MTLNKYSNRGLKAEDPYDVMEEEPYAKTRTCRYPGCKGKVRMSALYCDSCRAKHRHLWLGTDEQRYSILLNSFHT